MNEGAMRKEHVCDLLRVADHAIMVDDLSEAREQIRYALTIVETEQAERELHQLRREMRDAEC